MYENKTWGSIFLMLRQKAEELGRAPHLEDIDNAVELIDGLPYGGWAFVLGYAGIYPRAGYAHQEDYPLFLEDFADEQLMEVVKKFVWVNRKPPRERDVWCYIECIYRWGSWEETLRACGLDVPEDYPAQNPLPAPVEEFHKYTWRRFRRVKYRYRDMSEKTDESPMWKEGYHNV